MHLIKTKQENKVNLHMCGRKKSSFKKNTFFEKNNLINQMQFLRIRNGINVTWTLYNYFLSKKKETE